MDLSNRGTRGASVLVVDDNDLNRDALACLLRFQQYEVQSAADGPEALAFASERGALALGRRGAGLTPA